MREGHKAPVLRLDCGAGKTVIASEIARSMKLKGKKLLFLTHLKEIKEQTLKTLALFNVSADVETIIKVSHNLNKYNPDVIICDECNFALSKTWRMVLSHYDKAIKIGLSATPIRLSGEPMGDIFDDIIDFMTADDLISLKYLSPYDLYAPKLNYSVSKVPLKQGDFSKEDLFSILDKPKIYGDVLKYFKQYASDRKTIVFCTTIKHSEKVAEEFRLAGYNAESVDGEMTDKHRDSIIERFRTGEIQILCNVNLISFGFDVPDCECVISLRPTQSLCLYIQQYCRCLRYQENKRAMILDFANNSFRFGLPTEKREWSLKGKVKCTNKTGKPEILARQCNNCFKVYSGTRNVCPYCGYDNGKTRKEIENDKRVELEKFKAQSKIKQHHATSIEELVKIGKERGYKNPYFWAVKVYETSWRSKKRKSDTK